MNIKKLIIITTPIFILVLLGVLLRLVHNKPSSQPSQPKTQKVTIMMPFIPDIQWAAYYTAKNKGYYKDEGLDVEIQYSTKGSAGPVEQLVAKKIDFTLCDIQSVIMARSQDLDIVAVYPIAPTNVYYIVSEKNKNITTPADLIEKKVGLISSASGAYGNLLVILYSSNIDKDEVEIVQAGTALVPAFLEKKFDAAAIHLGQKLLIEEKIPQLNVIKASDYSNVGRGHVVVTRDLIKNNPELIKKFLRATKKGLEYAVNNPEDAVNIYISFNPDAEPQRKVSQDLWNALIKEHHYNTTTPGVESSEDWQKSQDVLYDTGLITKKTSISDMYTNEFVPQ